MILAAGFLSLAIWPKKFVKFFRKMSQEKSPTRSEGEDLEGLTTYDLARYHLMHPPFANDKATSVWLPNGSDLMQELMLSFQAEPRTLNLLMGQISKWTDFYPSDPNWMTKSVETETKWFKSSMELAEALYAFDARFGEDRAPLTGDPSVDDKNSMASCALDLMTTRTSMGPIFFIIHASRFKRSEAARNLKFNDQFVCLIQQALEVHTVNVRITKGKLTQGQALAEYRKLISRSANMEYQPSADDLDDLYESDKSRLMKLDLVFQISRGACRIGVRLMKRELPGGAADVQVSEEESDDDDCGEVATQESVSSGTRSQTNRRLSERISDVEARLKVVESRFNTLTPKGSRSRSSGGSSTGSRKRSRSPEIKRRNFMMNPRKRGTNGRHKSEF